jgi:hypothetical protein
MTETIISEKIISFLKENASELAFYDENMGVENLTLGLLSYDDNDYDDEDDDDDYDNEKNFYNAIDVLSVLENSVVIKDGKFFNLQLINDQDFSSDRDSEMLDYKEAGDYISIDEDLSLKISRMLKSKK